VKHARIIVTHSGGGSDALQAVEEERPEPKHGAVRVKALAAGVALPDLMAREAVHPETPLRTLHTGVGFGRRGRATRVTVSLESNRGRLLPRCRSTARTSLVRYVTHTEIRAVLMMKY
jgi:hypothetical protein